MSGYRKTATLGAAALLVSAAVGLTGCRARKDPVQALLDDLVAAAEAKNADGIRERLADDFRGQGGINRAEAVSTIRRYLAGYEKVQIEVYDVAIQRGDGSADMTFRVEFSGHARSIGGLDGLLPPGASYRFDLHVVDQGGTWKVERAAWESVAPPDAGR
jgi:hypothetical protein